ncbi:hypothetical protein MOO44_04375 [Nicoliella spurrieriana]|uniref:ABC transporter permease n=1 Tax=Nicoliella spurrieriana TaxID=2925830 RepID=A0A976RTG2_9LACO|nr:hypothetical protein [Nicoliella spurrieriana]UQS87394.1 hypothetical protein MOO44_04375 [Nicoliella spurrieriana]
MFNAIKETFAKKGKLSLIFGAILALYIIVVAIWGAFGNLINAENFFESLGTANVVIGLLMMILASLSFGSHDTREFLASLIDKGHRKIDVFFSQCIFLVCSYVFFMLISVILVILMQLIVFGGQDMHSFKQFNIVVYGNAIHMFIMSTMIMFLMVLCRGIKSRMGAIATGIGLNYVGLGIAWIGFLFVYHHRFLKWEPFNFLMVENQLIKPINHTLTKLYRPEAITGSLIYGVIFTVLALCLFLYMKPLKR